MIKRRKGEEIGKGGYDEVVQFGHCIPFLSSGLSTDQSPESLI